MKKVLTDKAIQSLKPALTGKRYIVGDALVPGLGIRVTDSGHRTFVLGARYPGSPHFKRREIGEVGAIGLAAARDKARSWISEIKAGKDPRDAQRTTEANTFAAVAEDFFKAPHVKAKRKAKVVEREIRTELIPVLGPRPIKEITWRDISQVISAVAGRGTSGAFARNILGHAKRVFKFAIASGILELSPCDRIKPLDLLGEKQVRTRVLDDDEIRAVWRAAGRIGYPFGTLTQLILLTGCRLSEVAEARWSEFGPQVWTIPSERFKSGQVHLIPLTPAMNALLASIPRWRGGDFLFSTTNGRQPVAGFADSAKARLDREMARSWRALGRIAGTDRRGLVPENATAHDLRRTVRTRLSGLRIPYNVAEMVVGHSKKGMARIYDQYEYSTEIREALTAWNAALESIVEPPPASTNVVPLRGVGS